MMPKAKMLFFDKENEWIILRIWSYSHLPHLKELCMNKDKLKIAEAILDRSQLELVTCFNLDDVIDLIPKFAA